MAAATYNSAQITSLDTVGAQLGPGLWGSKVMVYPSRIDLSAVSAGWDKSEDTHMFTYKAGDIPLAIGLIAGVSLGSSKIAIGISGTAAKYRASAAFTPVNIMDIVMIPDWAVLSADEEVWVTNSNDADMPTTTYLALLGFYTRH